MNRKAARRDFICVSSAIGLMVLLRLFVFTPVLVSGESMAPTLRHHDFTFALLNTEIERQDIITFTNPNNPKEQYVKRVIGLPGDEVVFERDVLYVNGQEILETYLAEAQTKLEDGRALTQLPMSDGTTRDSFSLLDITGERVVPENTVFVLGDNRRNSTDSRILGFIDQETIKSNLKIRVWPLSTIGKIE